MVELCEIKGKGKYRQTAKPDNVVVPSFSVVLLKFVCDFLLNVHSSLFLLAEQIMVLSFFLSDSLQNKWTVYVGFALKTVSCYYELTSNVSLTSDEI